MGLFEWFKKISEKKSEKDLLDDLYDNLAILNSILNESHDGLDNVLKRRLEAFKQNLGICERFRNSYPGINRERYRIWLNTISRFSGLILEQCSLIEERRTRVKYEEVIVKINDAIDGLLEIIDNDRTRQSTL